MLEFIVVVIMVAHCFLHFGIITNKAKPSKERWEASVVDIIMLVLAILIELVLITNAIKLNADYMINLLLIAFLALNLVYPVSYLYFYNKD